MRSGGVGCDKTRRGGWLYDATNKAARNRVKRGRNKELRQMLGAEVRKDFFP